MKNVFRIWLSLVMVLVMVTGVLAEEDKMKLYLKVGHDLNRFTYANRAFNVNEGAEAFDLQTEYVKQGGDWVPIGTPEAILEDMFDVSFNYVEEHEVEGYGPNVAAMKLGNDISYISNIYVDVKRNAHELFIINYSVRLGIGEASSEFEVNKLNIATAPVFPVLQPVYYRVTYGYEGSSAIYQTSWMNLKSGGKSIEIGHKVAAEAAKSGGGFGSGIFNIQFLEPTPGSFYSGLEATKRNEVTVRSRFRLTEAALEQFEDEEVEIELWFESEDEDVREAVSLVLNGESYGGEEVLLKTGSWNTLVGKIELPFGVELDGEGSLVLKITPVNVEEAVTEHTIPVIVHSIAPSVSDGGTDVDTGSNRVTGNLTLTSKYPSRDMVSLASIAFIESGTVDTKPRSFIEYNMSKDKIVMGYFIDPSALENNWLYLDLKDLAGNTTRFEKDLTEWVNKLSGFTLSAGSIDEEKHPDIRVVNKGKVYFINKETTDAVWDMMKTPGAPMFDQITLKLYEKGADLTGLPVKSVSFTDKASYLGSAPLFDRSGEFTVVMDVDGVETSREYKVWLDADKNNIRITNSWRYAISPSVVIDTSTKATREHGLSEIRTSIYFEGYIFLVGSGKLVVMDESLNVVDERAGTYSDVVKFDEKVYVGGSSGLQEWVNEDLAGSAVTGNVTALCTYNNNLLLAKGKDLYVYARNVNSTPSHIESEYAIDRIVRSGSAFVLYSDSKQVGVLYRD